MAEDGVEEVGEGVNQACNDGTHEEGIEGAPLVLRLGRAGLERSLPHLAALRHRHQAREGEILLRHVWGIQSRRVPGRWSPGRGLVGRHCSLEDKG